VEKIISAAKAAFHFAAYGAAEAAPYPFVLEHSSEVTQDGASPVSTRHFSASCEAAPFQSKDKI
jgi:hypothetical protein